MMRPQIETARAVTPPHALRKVVVVSRNPGQRLPDSLMDASDYDVVVLEPFAHAYSQIKRIAPNLIILCLSFEDPEAFQVLSMLHLDRETARIPLLTYAATSSADFQRDSVDLDDGMVQRTIQASMN